MSTSSSGSTFTPYSVWIRLNQNGTSHKASITGNFNIRVREPYKIEIFSPLYVSAISVKIDGISVIKGAICDRTITLEKAKEGAKEFIVLEEWDLQFFQDGKIHNPDLGLIEVTFTPVKRRAIASGSNSQMPVTSDEWVEAPEIAPTYTKKYGLFGFSAKDEFLQYNPILPDPPSLPNL